MRAAGNAGRAARLTFLDLDRQQLHYERHAAFDDSFDRSDVVRTARVFQQLARDPFLAVHHPGDSSSREYEQTGELKILPK